MVRGLGLRGDPEGKTRGPSYPIRMLGRFQELVRSGESKLSIYSTLRAEFTAASENAVYKWLVARRGELTDDLARAEQCRAALDEAAAAAAPGVAERLLRGILADLTDLPDPSKVRAPRKQARR